MNFLCRNSEYYGDESIRAATDGNLVHRTSGGDAGFDSQSVPQADVLKQENSEVAHTSQYAFPSSSPQYTFENAQQLNAAFNYSQTSAQMQNLTPFSNSMVTVCFPISACIYMQFVFRLYICFHIHLPYCT